MLWKGRRQSTNIEDLRVASSINITFTNKRIYNLYIGEKVTYIDMDGTVYDENSHSSNYGVSRILVYSEAYQPNDSIKYLIFKRNIPEMTISQKNSIINVVIKVSTPHTTVEPPEDEVNINLAQLVQSIINGL